MYIYNKLKENNNSNKRLDEAVVGVFYIINGEIYSDATRLNNAEEYGNYYQYGSHYDFYYNELAKYYDMPYLSRLDYDYYPRGRVVFDRNQHKYILYLDKSLETPEYIQMIADEFGLQNGGFYIGNDEHYTHQSKEAV